MSKKLDLLNKAREKSMIACGRHKDVSDEQQKNLNLFREANLLPHFMEKVRKDYKTIGTLSMTEVKSSEKLLENIEKHQKAVRAALRTGKINRSR